VYVTRALLVLGLPELPAGQFHQVAIGHMRRRHSMDAANRSAQNYSRTIESLLPQADSLKSECLQELLTVRV
jgi:hypothetical protein